MINFIIMSGINNMHQCVSYHSFESMISPKTLSFSLILSTNSQTTKARWTVDSMEKFGNLKLTKISKNTNNNI